MKSITLNKINEIHFDHSMNESTEISPCWVEVINEYKGINLIALLFYFIFGTIGNGLAIVIYRKQQKLTGRIYILLLAGIDLTACVFVVPQVPLYNSEGEDGILDAVGPV